MIRKISLAICFLALTAHMESQNHQVKPGLPGGHTYRPEDGYVPDQKTAIAIAEAVLLPIYGKNVLEKERPLRAVLKDDVWSITGTFHPRIKDERGGVVIAEISRTDGRILRVSHGM